MMAAACDAIRALLANFGLCICPNKMYKAAPVALMPVTNIVWHGKTQSTYSVSKMKVPARRGVCATISAL